MKDNKDLKKLERRICCVDGQVEDLAALVDQLAEDLAELIESGAGASFEQVTNYAALPAAGSHTGEYFHVLNSQGTSWLPGSLGGTYYSKGFYYSTGTDWVFVGEVPYQASQATVDAGTDNTQFVTASTLAGASKWSTKQDNITLTTSGTSGAATLAAGTLNIPQYQAALTNPVTGTGTNGQVTFWTGTNTQSGDNGLYWDNVNKELGIGNAAPASRLHVTGLGLTSATSSFIAENSGGTDKFVVKDNGSIEIGKNDSGTTQSTASITVTSGDTNTGLALVPKGNGAITAHIPDGTVTGGNARGAYAVDLQMVRTSATHVAFGTNSVVSGGERNRCGADNAVVAGGSNNNASASRSVIAGGSGNTASGIVSSILGGENNTSFATFSTVSGGWGNYAGGTSSIVAGGGSNRTSGANSATIGGGNNSASGNFSIVTGGSQAIAGLTAQRAIASGSFSANSDAQTSDIRYRNAITGTAKKELFLDGASVIAILALPTGATAGRLWNAKVQIAAVCTTQGNGTVTAGESFIGNYAVGISRIGTTTSLIGTVQNLHTPQTSTNMATAVVTITADDTNEALKIEFTPPTTAGSTTVIRVVATVYLTEVGY